MPQLLAEVSGQGGSVALATAKAQVKGWKLTPKGDVKDVTHMGSGGYKYPSIVLKSCDGSFDVEAGGQVGGEAGVGGLLCGSREGFVDAAVHLGGGLAGEGEHEDVARVDALGGGHPAGLEEPQVARREYGGLARAGAGGDDDIALGHGGRALCAFEVLGAPVVPFPAQLPAPKRNA